jgi:ATP-dependent helicase/nuclease subunit B
LEQLILDWLEIEKKRKPFIVESQEKERSVEIGGISLQTRIDRIDRLDDGRQVIIDYKTGEPKISAWHGDRPDEPQLPLYCISSREPVAAVAYAQLKRGKIQFAGLAEEAGLAPGINKSDEVRSNPLPWNELEARWREVITRLCEEIQAGFADADPKKFPETCKNCDLMALCRIHEGSPLESDETEENTREAPR